MQDLRGKGIDYFKGYKSRTMKQHYIIYLLSAVAFIVLKRNPKGNWNMKIEAFIYLKVRRMCFPCSKRSRWNCRKDIDDNRLTSGNNFFMHASNTIYEEWFKWKHYFIVQDFLFCLFIVLVNFSSYIIESGLYGY